MADNFGFLTLATPSDYPKAIGLALSLRVSNPGVPVAVACSPRLRPLLAPWFDIVVDERPDLRGFVHKVHLDAYSPFRETMFFDSDVLVFKPVRPYIDQWGPGPYHACGGYTDGGDSLWGLDRGRVLRLVGKPRFAVIDGAGHAFFRKPECDDLFRVAREVTADYEHYAGKIRYADEDVVAIAMTMLDVPPVPYGNFFSRYLSAKPGTLEMDATRGVCRFITADTGQPFEPCMMHFAAKEGPLAYGVQLVRLFRRFGVPIGPVVRLTLNDLFETKVRWPLGDAKRRVRAALARTPASVGSH